MRSWLRGLVLCAIGALSLGTSARSLADTGQVAVIEHDGSSYDARVGDAANREPRRRAARAFYQSHSDSYDFLVVFPTFDASFTEVEGVLAPGLFNPVRNEVSGIGMTAFADPGYGSAKRLHGFIDVLALPANRQRSLDESVHVVAHEIGHQWLAYVGFKDPVTGARRTDLLGMEQSHWSFFLDSDASLMYGSKWQSDGSTGFKAVESRRRFSALDLYLMGMLAPSEVPSFNLLRPLPGTPHLATDIPPADGTTIQATPETVTIADILAAEGPRVPAADASPHEFRAGFIVLTAPGEQATPDQLAAVDAVRRSAANAFFFLTRGRGVLETDLVDAPPGVVAENPSVALALQYLMAQQRADGSWADSVATADRETGAALEALVLFGADAQARDAVDRGVAYLEGPAAPDGTDAVARRLLALAATHRSTAALASMLESGADPVGRNEDSGFGYTSGYLERHRLGACRQCSGRGGHEPRHDRLDADLPACAPERGRRLEPPRDWPQPDRAHGPRPRLPRD